MTETADPIKLGEFTPEQDREIGTAALLHDLDPYFLKAMIAQESLGRWEGNEHPVDLPSQHKRILPYVGMMSGTTSLSEEDIDRLDGNRWEQTLVFARHLARIRDSIDPYTAIALQYYCGEPNPISESAAGYASRIYHMMQSLKSGKMV